MTGDSRGRPSANARETGSPGNREEHVPGLPASRLPFSSGPSHQPSGPDSIPHRVVPLRATYRLQLTPDFTLRDAATLVPYLARLGVSHVYASPVLRARSGSQHGYDVVDPTMVNPELGGAEALAELVAALRAHAMGLVLDVVPNHMATGWENPYWTDVLRRGARSPWARWFDVDWHAPDEELRGRVLVPVLGDRLGTLVARGELTLAWEQGELVVRYHEHRFPVAPHTVPRVAALGLEPTDAAAPLLQPLLARARIAPRDEEALAQVGDAVLALARTEPAVAEHLARAAGRFAQGPGGTARLRRLLDQQPYQLAHWRRAAREINYRRFFNIDELVALKQERPATFAETHATVLGWVDDGTLDGLRIDHVDGLRDPLGYLRRLRAEVDARAAARVGDGGEDAFPVFVEKILTGHERLREEWPVQGTTGYEALNALEAVFIDPAGANGLTRRWRALVGDHERALDFARVALECKRQVLRGSLASDVGRLVRLLEPVARAEPAFADVSREALQTAVVELLAHCPVYRTYVQPGGAEGEDRRIVDRMVAAAREAGVADPALLSFVGSVLRLDGIMERASDDALARRRVATRFQQVSGPAAAKGVEDTALYRYLPLVSRNEVGSEPDASLADAVGALHRANAERLRRWPRALVPVSTHDTKRGADTRARLDVLSEVPERWWRFVARARRLGARWVTRVGRRAAPDRNSEYLVYQTLLAIWPVDESGHAVLPSGEALDALHTRVREHVVKAVREGKSRSSWVAPNEAFEAGLLAYVDAVLDPARSGELLPGLMEIVNVTACPGFWNAVSRTVLQLAGPGTPDVYQGDELWHATLVDPDNRRPPDFALRARLLDELEARWREETQRAALLASLVACPGDGRLKLHVLARLLDARRAQPALFRDGDYLPLAVEGAAAPHLVAFARRLADGRAAVALAPRLTVALTGGRAPVGEAWGDAAVVLPGDLAHGSGWRCALSGDEVVGAGERLPVAAALGRLPAALLLAEPRGS